MSVSNELTRIQEAKENIRLSLSNEGVDIPSNIKLDKYNDYISGKRDMTGITYLSNPNNYLRLKFLESGKFYYLWRSTSTATPDSKFNLQYKKNNGSWIEISPRSYANNGTAVCDVQRNDEIWLKGTENFNAGLSSSHIMLFYIKTSALALVSGDIYSLTNFNTPKYSDGFNGFFHEAKIDIDPENPLVLKAPTNGNRNYLFANLFQNCRYLTNPPIISAENKNFYGEYCFKSMFSGCTALKKACEIPDISSRQAFSYMFSGCTALKKACEIKLTTPGISACEYMFNECSSLVDVPDIDIITTSYSCCLYMFCKCYLLKKAPNLLSTTLGTYCYLYMFQYCYSLEIPPELPATTLAVGCYLYMFNYCINLQNAPLLPATVLTVSGSSSPAPYVRMFDGCNSLNYIKLLNTTYVNGTSSSNGYTNYWMNSVMKSGTFVCKSGSIVGSGSSGIPDGWTVQYIS